MRTTIAHVANAPRHLYGWRKDRPDHRDLLVHPTAKKLPDRVDLRSICPPVEDQGQVGSCTANASTSMMESLYKRAGKAAPQLSRLFAYYMTRVYFEGVQPSDDSGCEIRNVMKALAKYGTCLEPTWPYTHPEANFAREPDQEAKREALTHQILSYHRCKTITTICSNLAAGWTCVGGFAVPESMMSARTAGTGIVDYPAPDEPFIGGHAIMFVGYDKTSKMLIFQNSWGTGWGRRGFGYLPFKYVTGGLADDFWVLRREEDV